MQNLLRESLQGIAIVRIFSKWFLQALAYSEELVSRRVPHPARHHQDAGNELKDFKRREKQI